MTGVGSVSGGAFRRRPLSQREWIAAAGLSVVFLPGLFALAQVWFRVDYLSHGFLVPIVAWWAALRERPRWHALPAAGEPLGAAALSLGLLVYFAGLAATEKALIGLGICVCVWGFVWLFRGAAWLRALAFPLAYLVFMVPPPPAWLTPTIVKLQLFVSWLAVEVSNATGLALAREGNVLLLPSGETLFVAEACSGVTSLVTLMPIGFLLAYFSLRRWWTWVALCIAVVPLAMLGNLARVMATVYAAEAWGSQAATEGWLHESAGLITYGVACTLLLAVGALLRRAERTPSAS
jgi:exosortase